jgi:hypothetical protein
MVNQTMKVLLFLENSFAALKQEEILLKTKMKLLKQTRKRISQ